MLEFASNYYYIVLGSQAVCALHCMRKGNQQKWIWLIVFLPVIGCLAYIFTEMFTRREMEQLQSGTGAIFNPSGKIKKLKSNLVFRDTFDNRLALADAYLEAGEFDSAIELYEKSLVDTFAEHGHGNMQLLIAYSGKRRFEDVITIAKKIYKLPQFLRSRPHMLYAIALGYMGQDAEAEKEFSLMKGKFSNYECRYQFGKFLQRANRTDEAKQVFREILNEEDHLSPGERRPNKIWFSKAKEEIKMLPAS